MTSLDERISVDVKTAAELTGLSTFVIRAAYQSGDLVVGYVGAKVVIPVDNLRAWVRGLPTERAS